VEINSSSAMVFFNNCRRHQLENCFYPNDFRKFPISNISFERQQSIADKTFATKAVGLKLDATALMRQIDNLIYRLYNLTYDGIKIIKPDFPLEKAEYEVVENG
jgi:hypothetical protein